MHRNESAQHLVNTPYKAFATATEAVWINQDEVDVLESRNDGCFVDMRTCYWRLP